MDVRSRLLRAAVGFALVPPTEPELRLLHRWLDCWRGVGDVVTGMNRQSWLHLSNVWTPDVARDVLARRHDLGPRVRRGIRRGRSCVFDLSVPPAPE
jgi:hypothetical protein